MGAIFALHIVCVMVMDPFFCTSIYGGVKITTSTGLSLLKIIDGSINIGMQFVYKKLGKRYTPGLGKTNKFWMEGRRCIVWNFKIFHA